MMALVKADYVDGVDVDNDKNDLSEEDSTLQ